MELPVAFEEELGPNLQPGQISRRRRRRGNNLMHESSFLDAAVSGKPGIRRAKKYGTKPGKYRSFIWPCSREAFK
jgi:hypothetical protein